MENFYLKRMRLSNYRRFENKEVVLNPQMNVLVGKNAAGKTTILDAATIMMGAYLAAFKKYVPSKNVVNILNSDVLLKAIKITNQDVVYAPAIQQYPCSVECQMNWLDKPFKRILEKKEGRTKFDGKNPMQDRVIKWESAIEKADGSDQSLVLPLVLYLSSARLWNENKSGEYEQIPSRMEAYQRCLDKRRSSQGAFGYIKILTNMAVEENDGKSYPAYQVIMDAVRYSLEEELESGQSVVYSSRFGEIAVKNQDGTVIRFASLSDGYRNVIKIVTDIATKMCILNPYLGAEVLKQTPGIVVIDELDLSLHPTWQKRIVRILKVLFPKVQFICATHSPFIIQSLDEGELIALDSILDEEYSGQSIEDIAEDVMNVSMPHYSEKKEKMYRAADAYFRALKESKSKEQIEKLKQTMDYLSAEYSDNPGYCALIKQKYLERKVGVEE